jgi:hypothetical protein
MTSARSDFEDLVYNRLIPEFCSDPGRNLDASGFRAESLKISEEDARYFLLAWQAGLIEHQGRGVYRAAQSGANEQFFWEGLRSERPRRFTLWLEPVITVGGLARLHFDFNWPSNLIGCQSKDWAFDVVAMLPGRNGEFIAGEVKKSSQEVDDLLAFMTKFARHPTMEEPNKPAKERNAFKKVSALRARQAPLFWALGPNNDSRVFQVSYQGDGIIDLTSAGHAALQFPTT